MGESYLFGLGHANHAFDGSDKDSFGKNIFTNAFPLALLTYLDSQGFGPMYIEAVAAGEGRLSTRCSESTLYDVIGCDSSEAEWLFEQSFDGYDRFATGSPERSDVVVRSLSSGKQERALEIKLVVVPNSATVTRPREQQSCEIVVRGPSVEQLCFSMAASLGEDRRHELGDMISSCLGNPMDYQWADENYMRSRLGKVINAAETIALESLDSQTPFALTSIWRTKGQAPILDDECFDAFVWSDMAFLQLLTRSATRGLGKESISRPQRAVVWLVKSLFDYSAQSKVTFGKTRSDITYGTQSDKAGSFAGDLILDFLNCDAFMHPRIPGKDFSKICSPEGVALLKPERRLDAALVSAQALGRYISIPS